MTGMKILQAIKKIINFILFPEKCLICGESSTKCLCNQCQKDLKIEFNPKTINTKLNIMCISCFAYKGKIRDIIHKFKFKCQKNASEILTNFLVTEINKKYKSQRFNAISYVPNYQNNYTRGYNQSKVLANNLSKKLKIPVKNCLIKIRDNKKQHKLSYIERQKNVEGVYACTENLEGQNILLCDDIITTGATLSECAKELRKSGANVFCATIAYTILKNQEKKCKTTEI